MAGTKEGAIKAAKKTKMRHGKDFYAKIGRKGGKKGTTGGFAANPKLAKLAGRKGFEARMETLRKRNLEQSN